MFPLAAVDGVIVNLSVKSSANQVKVELVIKCEHTHTRVHSLGSHLHNSGRGRACIIQLIYAVSQCLVLLARSLARSAVCGFSCL